MASSVIIGAGPAGLTAAHELGTLGLPAVVLEQAEAPGGLCRTFCYRGYRFDIGGHRFFTKVDAIQAFWKGLLGDDLLLRPRLSRIYYQGKFFDYPLKPVNALAGLGAAEAARIVLSYARAQLQPVRREESFEQWVTNRFGRRLFEIFFRTYTEKVWGMSCTEISADWAAQRIKNLDLGAALRNALFRSGTNNGTLITTLIDSFHYPRLGPGMMWERCAERAAALGIATELGARVVRVLHDHRRILAVVVRDAAGREREVAGEQFISSMPLRELLRALSPAAPPTLLEAAGRLRYRDFMTVALIARRPHLFPDNWIYVHSPGVRVGRVQNFANWSPDMVPDAATTSLGLEYFVQQDDDLWSASDPSLVDFAAREMETLGLLRAAEVSDGTVVREAKAYPVYDRDYREVLATIRGYLAGFPNLQLVGRNGQHAYNNQDHSMLAGILAARNVAGARHDVWAVSVDMGYLEEARGRTGEGRLVPEPRPSSIEDLVRQAFARYDPVALAAALATVAGAGLLLATAAVLLSGGNPMGAKLALLGNYLPGFAMGWRGAVLGAFEASVAGFAFGYVLARVINRLVGWEETALRKRLEMLHALDPSEAGRT
jgi:protoporphyrinogen oxidase